MKTQKTHTDGLNGIQAREDEEQSGAHSSTFLDLAQPEYDSSLVLLDLLHRHEQGEGEGADDEEHGEAPEEALHTGPTPRLLLLYSPHNDSLFLLPYEGQSLSKCIPDVV